MTKEFEAADRPFAPESLDLSKLSTEQLAELKDAIMARARAEVGPRGFNPIMMATDELVNPWDMIANWWDAIILSFRRLGLAILTSGLGLTAAGLYGTDAGQAWAPFAMGGAAIGAVWFVADMIRTPKSMERLG